MFARKGARPLCCPAGTAAKLPARGGMAHLRGFCRRSVLAAAIGRASVLPACLGAPCIGGAQPGAKGEGAAPPPAEEGQAAG